MEETPLEQAVRAYHIKEAATRKYKDIWTQALLKEGVRPTDLANAIGKTPNQISTIKSRLKKEAEETLKEEPLDQPRAWLTEGKSKGIVTAFLQDPTLQELRYNKATGQIETRHGHELPWGGTSLGDPGSYDSLVDYLAAKTDAPPIIVRRTLQKLLKGPAVNPPY